MDVGRRSAVLGAALTSLSRPPTSDLLSSSRIYAVSTDSARFKPALNRLSTSSLVRILRDKQAIYLGEHHPEFRDHLLQAALIRRFRGDRPLAVGLEMVQRQFQTALDDYVARRIDEQELFAATERFHEAAPWEVFANEQFLHLKNEATGEEAWAMVCGHTDYGGRGLNLFSSERDLKEAHTAGPGVRCTGGMNRLQFVAPDMASFSVLDDIANTAGARRWTRPSAS